MFMLNVTANLTCSNKKIFYLKEMAMIAILLDEKKRKKENKILDH